MGPHAPQTLRPSLVLGGIRTGQKAYGGDLSLEARIEGAEELDAADIAAQIATDFVENYTTSARNLNDWTGALGLFEDDEEWWVDFEYMVKEFLSHAIQQVFCLHSEEDLLLGIKMIRNFLNYANMETVRKALVWGDYSTELGHWGLTLPGFINILRYRSSNQRSTKAP